MSDQDLVRPTPVSGFSEWLPEVRLIELQWLDRIRTAFERYGFSSIETPAVEKLEVLMAKGETSQEVYKLSRLQAEPGDDTEARLGLHFDLTVPFARYVAQHFNDLVFPFKRYQVQRVWRGEKPQVGRYREFTQCDIDVINVDDVPLHFDAELPRIIHEVLTGLDLPAWSININNRKVLQGFCEGLGIADPLAVIRAVDKLDKIGADGVVALLRDRVGLAPEQIGSCLELARLRGTDSSVIAQVRALGVESALLEEGLTELAFVLNELADLPAGSIVADFSIVRGLDYYTGTVYEGKFVEWPEYGSICSGGRYENLAGSFIRRSLPGIGMSIGLTRIFAKMVADGLLRTGASTPSEVLVVVPNEEARPRAVRTAAALRARGFNTEIYHKTEKIAKQIRYASRKGIPFVWFPPFEEGKPHEIKNLDTGLQVVADPESWTRD
ncbi:histidine--tRNA ligase [Saccharothrix sp. ALI-22-I]|uniref:histidine--tRNA ligase n=1 Tax=Saccharothrix sp. ALI-22-I TaxID=1933778 RepID=UPI00097BF593|nr:histidine--tRNA ligase [Saccharothrix sp. ALI-22-I]ONI91306.1 histidine--tRNA ligase [Saccharothrix sp. ALI-22-I]